MATHFRLGPVIRATAMVPLLVCLVRPSTTSAQDWAPDSAIVRLAWGTVNALVRADTTRGVHVWVATSPIDHRGQQLSFAAYFDPQTLEPWLNLAHAVVTATSRPSDSDIALQTPALEASDGSRLVLVRRREKNKWEKHAAILLLDREERHPWHIRARPEDGQRFLRTLFQQSGRSRYAPDSTAVYESNPLDTGTCPQPLPGNPVPRYPDGLRRLGLSGEVWLSFVVRVDSTPDPSSFEVVLSDASDFAQAAIAAVGRSRYRPGHLGGAPVAMRVYQRFTFLMR